MSFVQTDKAIYADLDTFFYNCDHRDEDSGYTYGCNAKGNETDGQCLDCGCPFLSKVCNYIGDKERELEVSKIEEHLCIIFKEEPENDGYLEQEDGWGEDTIMAYYGELSESPFNLK